MICTMLRKVSEVCNNKTNIMDNSGATGQPLYIPKGGCLTISLAHITHQFYAKPGYVLFYVA